MQLKPVVALSEDLGSVPSTHLVVHDCPVPRHPMPSSDLGGHQARIWSTQINAGTHTHTILKKKKVTYSSKAQLMAIQLPAVS